jgi:hypothetical protein
MNQQILISQIEEVGADIGEPDCKLIEPFILNTEFLPNQETPICSLSPWLIDITSQNTFMLSSDKILTLVDPKPTLLQKYEDLIK